MKEERPIIALDFSSFEETKAFFRLISSRRKAIRENWYGIILCARTRYCSVYQIVRA